MEKLTLDLQNRRYVRNIEDTAKVTINGLYKAVHELSIAAKMYDPALPRVLRLWRRRSYFLFLWRDRQISSQRLAIIVDLLSDRSGDETP